MKCEQPEAKCVHRNKNGDCHIDFCVEKKKTTHAAISVIGRETSDVDAAFRAYVYPLAKIAEKLKVKKYPPEEPLPSGFFVSTAQPGASAYDYYELIDTLVERLGDETKKKVKEILYRYEKGEFDHWQALMCLWDLVSE